MNDKGPGWEQELAKLYRQESLWFRQQRIANWACLLIPSCLFLLIFAFGIVNSFIGVVFDEVHSLVTP